MKKLTFIAPLIILTSNAFALPVNQFYGSLLAGIYQAQFNSSYLDQTDDIPANVSDTFMQNGYTGGVAIGYTHLINPSYFVSLELAGNWNGHTALYQNGGTSTSFSDSVSVDHQFDLTVIPGVVTASAFFPYIKLGISQGHISDSLTSPAGYDPVMTQYNSTKTVYGFVAGLGVRYAVNDRFSLSIETNYHDYGTVNFPSFQNFTATYSHSAHIYAYAAQLGATYNFNI